MIYYFSGTGNSKWVATQLAVKTNDVAVSIMDVTEPASVDKQVIGVVFPVYAWGAPEPVLEFLKKLEGAPVFTFGVATCGEDAGNALDYLGRLLPLNSKYSISMPNNYVFGSDVESKDVVLKKIRSAKCKLDGIGKQILEKQSVTDVHKGSLPFLKSTLANFGFNKFARTTKPFYVTEKCISCGKCANNCPAHTIKLLNGKPTWDAKCYQCGACINACPTKAIEYGKNSANRGRYFFSESFDCE